LFPYTTRFRSQYMAPRENVYEETAGCGRPQNAARRGRRKRKKAVPGAFARRRPARTAQHSDGSRLPFRYSSVIRSRSRLFSFSRSMAGWMRRSISRWTMPARSCRRWLSRNLPTSIRPLYRSSSSRVMSPRTWTLQWRIPAFAPSLRDSEPALAEHEGDAADGIQIAQVGELFHQNGGQALDLVSEHDADAVAPSQRRDGALQVRNEGLLLLAADDADEIGRHGFALLHGDLRRRRIRPAVLVEHHGAVADHIDVLLLLRAEERVDGDAAADGFETGFLHEPVAADAAGPDDRLRLDLLAIGEHDAVRRAFLDPHAQLEGDAASSEGFHGVFHQRRIKSGQGGRRRLHVVDLHEGRIDVELLAQLRHAVGQLPDKFDAGETGAADDEGQIIRPVGFALVFGEHVFNVLADQVHGVDAAVVQGVLLQAGNAERLRFPAETDHEVIVGQRAVGQNHFLFVWLDLHDRRFDEVDLELVDEGQNIDFHMLRGFGARRRH